MPTLYAAVDQLLNTPAPASMPAAFAEALAELRATRARWVEDITGVAPDIERAIRRDERRLIAQLAGDDIHRVAHLINRVLSNPAATNDARQRAARLLDKDTRKKLAGLLDGDIGRFGLFLAALVEQIDPDWQPEPGTAGLHDWADSHG